MQGSAHVDTWVIDHLPPAHLRPELVYDLPDLQLPDRLNCAVAILDRHLAEGRGAAPAVQDGERLHTYAELSELSNRLAHVLVDDLGVVPGNRVLLMGYNGMDLLAAWYAVMKAGAVAVTVAPSLRTRELEAVLARAEVDVGLADRRLHPWLAEAGRSRPAWRCLAWGQDGDLAGLVAAKPGAFPVVDTLADDPCVLAFTSGTTGTPKAAIHTHREVVATCAVFAGAPLAPTSSDVFTGSSPLAFTFGLMALGCYPLYVGASVVLRDRAGALDLLETIERYRVTVCFTVPTVYRKWLRLGVDRARLATLRVAVSSAEALTAQDWIAFREATGLEIVNVLGSTELLHAFMSTGVAPPRPGSVGKPIRGYRAAVLDDDGRELPDGEAGRLAIKGPTGCAYLNDPRQIERICAGWTLTGDRASRDVDGYYWLDGRVDDLVMSSGYTIAPAEVEAVLLEHPGVEECLVLPRPDAVKGLVLEALVVPTAKLPAGEEAPQLLREYVLNRLASYKCPAVFELVDHLPRTATGKVMRRRSG